METLYKKFEKIYANVARSPKFPVNVILCAQPPDSMASLLEYNTQTHQNDWCMISKCCDMISARYIP